MIIRLPLRVEGSRGEKFFMRFLIAGLIIRASTTRKYMGLRYLLNYTNIYGWQQRSSVPLRELDRLFDLILTMRMFVCRMSFLVVAGLSEQVIIGATTMQKWKLKLDFGHDKVIVDLRVAKQILINLI